MKYYGRISDQKDLVTKEYADKAGSSIPFGYVDATSTSTAYTATVPGITSLEDGVCVMLKNGIVTSEAGFTININGLGAKPSYSNMAAATQDTTIFNINYTMLFVYDSTRVGGGCWICYRGYDSNSNTIGYQLRTNSSTLPASDKGYRYRLWFTSADGTKWVPANLSTSTNATASRTPNTRPINPFGAIVYYSTNDTTSAGANLTATTLWQQYTLSLGYSFNTTGAALTLTNPAPVYVKCTPQANGSAVIQGYTQTLPSTKDGYIYIFLGIAYSATSVELRAEHPVYYHDGSGIRQWTGAALDTTVTSGSTNGVTSGAVYTALDEVKTSVSSGKALIAAAVTGKGVSTAATDSFQTMATNISLIPTGGTPTLQNKTVVSNGVVTADSGYDGLGTVTVAIPVYDGTVVGGGNND